MSNYEAMRGHFYSALKAEVHEVNDLAELRRMKHNCKNKLWRLKQHMDTGMWNDDRDDTWLRNKVLCEVIEDKITELKRNTK